MARRERPLRIRFVFLALASAVAAVLPAGCGGGGGDDPAKVEANLRAYLGTLVPGEGGFPVGAGPPRVKKNSCRKIPKRRVPKGGLVVGPQRLPGAQLPKEASWSCVVRFAHTPFHVLVALKANGEVASVTSLPRHALRPATVYQGGPKQPQP
jgi:hypothetical protein